MYLSFCWLVTPTALFNPTIFQGIFTFFSIALVVKFESAVCNPIIFQRIFTCLSIGCQIWNRSFLSNHISWAIYWSFYRYSYFKHLCLIQLFSKDIPVFILDVKYETAVFNPIIFQGIFICLSIGWRWPTAVWTRSSTTGWMPGTGCFIKCLHLELPTIRGGSSVLLKIRTYPNWEINYVDFCASFQERSWY